MSTADHLQNLAFAGRAILREADIASLRVLVAAIEWAESERDRLRAEAQKPVAVEAKPVATDATPEK